MQQLNLKPSHAPVKDALCAGTKLAFDPIKVRRSMYRPFTFEWLYFDGLLNQRQYQQHRIFPMPAAAEENRAICVGGYGRKKFATLIVDKKNT